MPIDYDSLQLDQTPPDPFNPPQEKSRPWFDLGDMALAPARGLISAAKGAYNLVDTVGFDFLPDWKKNPLGESSSVAGALIEGAVQFTAGFLPFGGGAIPFVGKFAGILPKAASALGTVGRVAGASAAASFITFEGHAGRLSDLIEEHPSLSNPITEFLSNHEDDPELLGRLKGAIENAGLGAMMEGIILGVKAVRAGQAVRDVGGTPQQVDEAVAAAAPAEEAELAMRASQGQTPAEIAAASPELPKALETRLRREFTPEQYSQFLEESAARFPNVPPDEAAFLNGMFEKTNYYQPEQVKALRESLERQVSQAEKATAARAALPPETRAQLEAAEARVQAKKAAPAPEPEAAGLLKYDDLPPELKAEFGRMNRKGLSSELIDWNLRKMMAGEGGIAGSTEVRSFKELQAVQKLRSEVAPTSPAEAAAMEARLAKAAPPPKEAAVPGVSDTPQRAKRLPILQDLGLDEGQVAKFNAAFESKQLAYEGPGAGIPEQIPGNLNPRNLDVSDRIALGLQKADLPLQNFRTPDRAAILLRTVEDLYRSEMGAITDVAHVKSLEEMADQALRETAAMVGMRDPAAFQAAVAVRSGKTLASLRVVAPRVLSDRFLLSEAPRQHVALMDKIRQVQAGQVAGNVDEMILNTAQNVQFIAGLQASVRGQAREAGRLLRSFAVKTGNVEIPSELMRLASDPVKLAETLNAAGGREFLLKSLTKLEEAYKRGGAEAMHKAVQGTVGAKFLAMTTEAFMGSILSSPKTAVVNFFGHTFGALYLPLERALGSMVIRMSGGKLAPGIDVALQNPIVAESMNQLVQLKASAVESFRIVKESGFSPENTLTDARITERFARRPAITAANAGLTEASVAGKAVEWVGKAARLPTDVLGTADNFAKNTIYRQYARARFHTEALQAGLKDGAAIAEHVESRLQSLIQEGQAYTQQSVLQRGVNLGKEAGLTDPDAINRFATDYYAKNFDESLSALSKEAAEHTNIATFTNAAQPGTFTYSFQRLIQQHPALRLVAPFVNTPANLLKAAAQRADAVSVARYVVGRVWPETMPNMTQTTSRFLQDMLSGDPVRAANAVGRVSTGAAAAVFFTHEALSGNITGRGPADKQQRQALMDAGWLPYSFKVGDSYISYARLDPFATFIGTAADFAAALNRGEDIGDEDVGMIAGGLASAMANNFTNKSYLTGVANLIAALQEPEKQVPVFFRKQAAAFVPNILSTAGYGVGEDPTMREVRSVMDGIMAKIPGLSDNLPPRRNILGEPLERPHTTTLTGPAANLVETWNPVLYSEVKDDTVKRELAALGHSWEAPKRTMAGKDLTEVPAGKTNAYDRWQELQGTVEIGGVNLRAALLREIRSRGYQRLPQESTVEAMSPRAERITRIVNDYREHARQQLFKELPQLKDHVVAVGNVRRQRRRGIESSIIPQ